MAITFAAPIDPPGTFSASAFGDALNTPITYYVTAVDADGKESNGRTAATTAPSSNNWNVSSGVNLSWASVPGADEYRLYKAEYNGRPGFIVTVSGTSYTDRNVSPSVSEGVPKYRNPFGDGNYPGCVCIFEQRLVYASSLNQPQTIWMSKSGDYENFADYTPIADDSPVELTIASSEVSSVNWMVALRSLILGTSGLEWEIAGEGGKAFSAKNARAIPQSYWGSALKNAIIVGNIILHVSSSGAQVRNLQYEFSSDSYAGSDLSIFASHLFEANRIVDWTYQKNPDSVIWAVRDDGSPIEAVHGLDHLEGKTVSILADGAVIAPRVVSGGKVTLDYPASTVIVGLEYSAEMQTMPVEVVGANGSSVCLKKYINVVDLMLRDSIGMDVGPNFNKLDAVKFREKEKYGEPTQPYTGIKSVTMPQYADNVCSVCIRSVTPTPVTVLAIVSRVQVNT